MKNYAILPLAILLALAGSSSEAQTIDYGSLESLFEEPVTTSATGTPQRVTDAPADMRIITAEEIRRSGATDIPAILRNLAGVDLARASFSAVDATVRGYNQPYSPRLLVLINGRQVYKDYYAYTAWNVLPVNPAEIRQIEVVKGPNAALFGFNAVAGVVNIITYSPLYDDVDNVTLRAGSQEYREIDLVHTAKLGSGGVRLSAGSYEASEFDTDLPPWEQGVRVDPRKSHIAADALFQVAEGSQLGFELTHVDARQTNLLPFYGLASSDYETGSAKGSWSADTGIGLVEALLYHNRASVLLETPFLGAMEIENRTTVARLQDLFKVGAGHTFRVTGEYRRNELESTPIKGGEVHYDVWSLGAMWDWALSQRLSLTNALRFDQLKSARSGYLPEGFPFRNADYSQTMNEESWNSALTWRLTDEETVRLLAGRGVQLPSMIEGSFMAQMTTPMGTIGSAGDPTLEPTRVTNLSLVYDRRIEPLASTLRTSLFHQENENLKSVPGTRPDLLPPQSAYPFFLFRNVGDSSADGIELTLSGAAREWRWELNYSYELLHDQLTVNRGGELTHAVDFENGTPRHKANAHLGWSSGPWEIDGYLHYVSDYALLENGGSPMSIVRSEIPAYTLFDARLGYRLTEGLTVALSGQGLNQEHHAESAGPEVERRLLLTLSLDY